MIDRHHAEVDAMSFWVTHAEHAEATAKMAVQAAPQMRWIGWLAPSTNRTRSPMLKT
jgi:hypothetical protein